MEVEPESYGIKLIEKKEEPKNNRVESFHSTHSMEPSVIEKNNNNGYSNTQAPSLESLQLSPDCIK